MTRTRFRWFIVSLLFTITIINYIDRSAIAYALNDMSQFFAFNPQDAGLIMGVFGIGYFISTFLGGIAVDRYGSHRVLFLSVLIWSLAIGWTGLVQGFIGLYLARMMLGLAEGPNFPAMTRAVGDWLSVRERATALSYSLMAVPLALAIGAPIVSQLIVHFGWRGMFIALSMLGLLWLPLWWKFFRDLPGESARVNAAELSYINDDSKSDCSISAAEKQQERRNVKGLWKFLLSNPTLLVNNWAFFVFGYFLFFFMSWLPDFLLKQYHLNLTQVGLFSIMPWLLAAVMLWGMGYVSDWILQTTKNPRWSRSYPIAISQLLAALCIVPLILWHEIVFSMIFISLAVAFSMSANAMFYAINVDIAKERAGTALGIMDTFFALAGFLAPVITGWLIYITGSFRMGFLVLITLALSSVILVLLFHHPEREKVL